MCLRVMIRSRGLPAVLRAGCSGTALPLRDRTNLSKRDQHFCPPRRLFLAGCIKPSRLTSANDDTVQVLHCAGMHSLHCDCFGVEEQQSKLRFTLLVQRWACVKTRHAIISQLVQPQLVDSLKLRGAAMWPFMTPQGYSSESNLSGMQGGCRVGGGFNLARP
jgi:hypothetical protein